MIRSKKIMIVALGVVLLAGSAFATTVSSGSDTVLKALKARLPATEMTKVDCSAIDGLCEVTAGKSLFYVDRSARYLIVGHVFDMETRQDLTSARLMQINPDALVGAAPQNSDEGGAPHPSLAAGTPVAHDYPMPKAEPAPGSGVNEVVSLASLPAAGAISWGSGSQKITIFTDFRCGYCRTLSTDLETMNIRVVERPISILGTRELTNRVYCAKNRERALHLAYAGEVPPAASCDTSGLDANERFAREHGFTGTPVIVRSDGAVLQGYRSKEFLLNWLKGAKS